MPGTGQQKITEETGRIDTATPERMMDGLPQGALFCVDHDRGYLSDKVLHTSEYKIYARLLLLGVSFVFFVTLETSDDENKTPQDFWNVHIITTVCALHHVFIR